MIDKLLWVGFVIFLIVFIHFIANFIFKRVVKGKVSKRKETISLLIVNVFKYVGLIIGLVVILAIFGVDMASVLAGAGLLGILLGFGLQKLMQDMINGFFIIFENQYVVGEYVGINDIVGEVLELGLKTTKLLTYNGEEHYFANGDIKSITNYSRNKILENKLISFEHDSILERPKVLGVNNINEFAYSLRITCVTKSFEHFGVARKLKTEIIKALEENGIRYLNKFISIK